MKNEMISKYIKRLELNKVFKDLDKKTKKEIKALDLYHTKLLFDLDKEHLLELKKNMIHRREQELISNIPLDVWNIEILIEDVYKRFNTSRRINEILSNDKKLVRKL